MKKRTMKEIKATFLTAVLYGSIGFTASIALFLVFYWSLRLNASIDNLVRNFYGAPFYFWPYVILTIGTLILFGINIPLLIYRFRKYGFPKLKQQAGGGLGTVIGIFASACPVCGSTLLSAIGIAGGLTVFPLQGLELKALSFGLMLLPIFLITKELIIFRKGGKECPIPKDPSFKRTDWPWLIFLTVITFIFSSIAWNMLKTDPAITRLLSKNTVISPGVNARMI